MYCTTNQCKQTYPNISLLKTNRQFNTNTKNVYHFTKQTKLIKSFQKIYSSKIIVKRSNNLVAFKAIETYRLCEDFDEGDVQDNRRSVTLPQLRTHLEIKMDMREQQLVTSAMWWTHEGFSVLKLSLSLIKIRSLSNVWLPVNQLQTLSLHWLYLVTWWSQRCILFSAFMQ